MDYCAAATGGQYSAPSAFMSLYVGSSTSSASGKPRVIRRSPQGLSVGYGSIGESTGASIYRDRIRLVVNDVLFEVGAFSSTDDAGSGAEKFLPPAATAEKLTSIQSTLGLSITQLAEIFGVTRKTVYDWFDGTEPRTALSGKIDVLSEVIANNSGVDLKRLKSVWGIPVSGKSFRELLAEDGLDRESMVRQASAKLAELGPRIGAGRARVSGVKLGNANLSDIDRVADVG
ncbi:hypothetical protein [Pseudomonas citronellolis]|uniref:hypothetical protein n=1 Tax=Pseudomonas citronellolis TaxID=53408 RepID=UPI000ABB5637|nr:hypothetical protein [Pseudomonas citronellolis]